MTDHDELRQIQQRYARGVDDRDFTMLESIFHPEAVFDGVQGRKPIAEWLETMRAPRSFPVSMHVLGEPLIVLSPDGLTAELDTYAVVYQVGDEAKGQSALTLGMRYRDTAVRHDGRWVIRHRRSETLWMR